MAPSSSGNLPPPAECVKRIMPAFLLSRREFGRALVRAVIHVVVIVVKSWMVRAAVLPNKTVPRKLNLGRSIINPISGAIASQVLHWSLQDV